MKVVLTEEQKNNLKLEPFIYKAILNKNTSLGDNPAIPPYGDFGLEYHVIKNKFEEVSEIIDKYIEDGKLESKDPDYLISVLSQKIVECKEKEEPIRPQLQKLCENIVNSIFAIPVETVLLECKLTDEVKPENNIRVLPENFDEFDENAYNFEDVDEVELANKAILKRRFINCLIQGLSYWLSTDIDDWCDTVVGLDKDIWNLWYNIIHISDYLLFVKDQKIDEKHPKLMSYVEVKLGRLGKKTSIKAQGVILPFLLRDTIRGFLELFSSHGLPNDTQKAMYVVKKADFLVAEPWDLRLGMGIMDMLHTSLTKIFQSNLLFTTQRIPYFFKMLCSLKTDEFNSVMKNFLLHTNKGKIIAKEFDDTIARDIDYQKFKDRIQQKNIETSVINDGDFSKEELDGYVLQENETDEMMGYHGSHADFDRFNHKKYLDTGMGDHAFGWGTYVTNDETIGRSYASDDTDTDFMKKFNSNIGQSQKDNFLYEVEIPDDNGSNYIDWYKPVSIEHRFNIMRNISYLEQRFNFEPSDSLYEMLGTNRRIPGSLLYSMLSNNLESEKAASLCLMYCGYDGIKYPAGTMWEKPKGSAEDAYNYVIFDANKVKIVNKTKM